MNNLVPLDNLYYGNKLIHFYTDKHFRICLYPMDVIYAIDTYFWQRPKNSFGYMTIEKMIKKCSKYSKFGDITQWLLAIIPDLQILVDRRKKSVAKIEKHAMRLNPIK
jgi:hypothetical protein